MYTTCNHAGTGHTGNDGCIQCKRPSQGLLGASAYGLVSYASGKWAGPVASILRSGRLSLQPARSRHLPVAGILRSGRLSLQPAGARHEPAAGILRSGRLHATGGAKHEPVATVYVLVGCVLPVVPCTSRMQRPTVW